MGQQIVIAYRLALANGMEVDSATEEDPFEYVVGDGSLIAALESLLIGMREGERQQFLIAAEEGFGLPDPAQIHRFPRDTFQAEVEGETLAPGVVISFEAPSGDLVPATIVALHEEEIEVDFNHPLAGRDLQFEVEILSAGGKGA